MKNEMRQDVRLQLYITPQMDDKLDELCQLMGMRKNEVVRMIIGTYVGNFQASVDSLSQALKGAVEKASERPSSSPAV